MISFLTNQQTPKRLDDALKRMKQNSGKNTHPPKDKLLVFLGVSFLSGLFLLLTLLVLSMFFIY